MVKIVKHNKTLLYMKLMSFQYYPIPETEEHYDHVVSAIAAALQGNTTLQEFKVVWHHYLSQQKAFMPDKRLVLE